MTCTHHTASVTIMITTAVAAVVVSLALIAPLAAVVQIVVITNVLPITLALQSGARKIQEWFAIVVVRVKGAKCCDIPAAIFAIRN
jgi:hypothetical protein